jgi:uncharacterized protein YfbU (UPF0304 family)
VPSCGQKISIHYGFEGFEIRNNFPYRNFIRFKVKFELKFRETKRSQIHLKFELDALGKFQNLMNIGNGVL